MLRPSKGFSDKYAQLLITPNMFQSFTIPEDGSVGCLFCDVMMFLHLEVFSDRYKLLMQLEVLSISVCR